MKYFLDSAKLDEIELAYRDYGIDGVTTNPKHIKNSGESFETVVQQLAEFAADKPDFPISVEVNPHPRSFGLFHSALRRRSLVYSNFSIFRAWYFGP